MACSKRVGVYSPSMPRCWNKGRRVHCPRPSWRPRIRSTHTNEYAPGTPAPQQKRPIPHAPLPSPPTRRFFRAAGVAAGQRVLDLGSGGGDVSLIAGRLVGSAGEVVGAERDPRAIARARARAKELQLEHVHFTQADIADLPIERPFDAVVGRYILMFLRDPAAVLRSVSKVVRLGGIFAFQEPCWTPFLQACELLPLWRPTATLIGVTFH